MVHTDGEVLKLYPKLSCSNHLRSGSINMMKMYGLSVSHCMVPQLISIGGVVPKQLLVNEVVEFLYMSPMISTGSAGKPRSFMRASNRAWYMEPKALQKSMYVRYMSLWLVLRLQGLL